MMLRKDVTVAVVLAVVFHGGVALVRIPEPAPPSFLPDKTVVISFVSHASPPDMVEDAVPGTEGIHEPERYGPEKREIPKKEKALREIQARTPKEAAEKRERQTEKERPKKKQHVPSIQHAEQVEPTQPARSDEPAQSIPKDIPDVTAMHEGCSSSSHDAPVVASNPVRPIGDMRKDRQVSIQSAIPCYKTNPPPPYPAIARRRGYEGEVILSVMVAVDGTVAESKIKQSSGYSMLDRAAMNTVAGWTFEPARRMGIPVPLTVEIPVRFVLRTP